MKLLSFASPAPVAEAPNDQQLAGKVLYDLYREERGRQGWWEFEWDKLSEMQQLVWIRVVIRQEPQ